MVATKLPNPPAISRRNLRAQMNPWCPRCNIESMNPDEPIADHLHWDADGLHYSWWSNLLSDGERLRAVEIIRYRPLNGRLEVDGVEYQPNPMSHSNQPIVALLDDIEDASGALMCWSLGPMTERELDNWVKWGDISDVYNADAQ